MRHGFDANELSGWRRARYFAEALLVGLAPFYLIRVPESWRPSDPVADNLFQVLVMWSSVALGWLVLKLRGESINDIGIRKPKSILRTVGLGLLLALFIFSLSQLRDYIGTKPNLSWLYPLRGNLPLTLSTMAVGFLGAGISEEFVWRGVVMHSLARAFGERRWSWVLAAILQAGGFTIGHAYMGFYGMIWAFLLALVLAAAFFLFRRNLIVLMIGHGVHNILKMVLFYFGVAI